MFTGLIAALGTVERLAEGSTNCRLTVRAPQLLSGVKIGDSIAVNGVCLTVVHLRGDTFTADVMPETVRRTTLYLLQPGDRVNLEKALRPTDGLDGHIVQGHVEGVGTIQQIISEDWTGISCRDTWKAWERFSRLFRKAMHGCTGSRPPGNCFATLWRKVPSLWTASA